MENDSCITRRRAGEVAENADSGVIDLSDVEFVSLAAADEFVHQAMESDLQLELSKDVQAMFEAIVGRSDEEEDVRALFV